MAHAPTRPSEFPGWSELAPLEAEVWGYLLMPGPRCLKAYAIACRKNYSGLKNAKYRGQAKLTAAARETGRDFKLLRSEFRERQAVYAV